MTLTFSLDNLKQLKDIIRNETMYSFLDKYIKNPKVNTHKLSILAIVMDEASLSIKKQEEYITATMLVQIALDTHAYLPENDGEETETSLLSKQLTVLGGDYYSSLYYVLLSESEDINFIQTLASAIKDVNEQKMELYFQTSTELNDYVQLGRLIESHIICSVADYVEFPHDTRIIADLILLDLLITEKKHILMNNQPFFFVKNQIELQLSTHLDHLIETNMNQVKKQLSSENKLYHQFQNVLNYISQHYIALTEEGSM